MYILSGVCGNIEPTARHFDLFSPLLSCSPYTLYTAQFQFYRHSLALSDYDWVFPHHCILYIWYIGLFGLINTKLIIDLIGAITAYCTCMYGICIYNIGPSDDNQNTFTHELRGVIPRSFEYLFSLINREKLKVHVHVIKYLISSTGFPFLIFKLSIFFFLPSCFPVILLFVFPIFYYSSSSYMYILLLQLFIHSISCSSSSFYILLLQLFFHPTHISPIPPLHSSYLLLLLFILYPISPILSFSYMYVPV